MRARRVIDTDVCIVGAGIVGLAHAFEARARGLRVAVVDRDGHAAGASVRNFGHVFVSAMGDGKALDYALGARERWLELAGRAGFEALGHGTIVVARHEDELQVLAGLCSDPRRGAHLIDAHAIAQLVPVPTSGVVGGMHAELDLRVDPRKAPAALSRLLERDDQVQLLWRAHVHAIEPGRVESSGATLHAPLVIVCPGPAYDALPPELVPTRHGLTRCKLQMLRVAAPHGRRYGPALLTGLSLLRYPGFTSQPGFEDVRRRLEADRPDLLEAGVNLIVSQLDDGDLLIGDTHEYGDTVSPFGDERLDALLLAEAAELLGAPALEVRERWHGIYPSAPGDPFMVEMPFPGAAVVGVVSGVGMTTALGLAPHTLDALIDGRPVSPAAPPLSGAAHAGYGS